MAAAPATIAVIVPVLNEARLLPALGRELLRAAERCDVVIVDGGSSDGSRLELTALERPRCPARGTGLRVLDSARGRARQMNLGARATSAPILLFLHADTRLPAHGFDAVEGAIACGAVAGCFHLRIASADLRLRLAAQIINLRSRIIGSATGDQAIFVRREIFECIGGYRELALCEDLDLVRRLRAHGPFLVVDDEVETSARRWERHGVARTIGLMWMLRLGYHLGVDPAQLSRLYDEAR
jgi:rSAM/selenodomain-associated transferase 2